jgi:hypothetical protein
MKTEKFQLCGNNSVCAGAFKLLRNRAGNNEDGPLLKQRKFQSSLIRNNTCTM